MSKFASKQEIDDERNPVDNEEQHGAIQDQFYLIVDKIIAGYAGQTVMSKDERSAGKGKQGDKGTRSCDRQRLRLLDPSNKHTEGVYRSNFHCRPKTDIHFASSTIWMVFASTSFDTSVNAGS